MSESKRVCEICRQAKELDEMVPLDWIRGTVGALLHRQHPDCNPEGFICLDDLRRLRASYVDDVMETQKASYRHSKRKSRARCRSTSSLRATSIRSSTTR